MVRSELGTRRGTVEKEETGLESLLCCCHRLGKGTLSTNTASTPHSEPMGSYQAAKQGLGKQAAPPASSIPERLLQQPCPGALLPIPWPRLQGGSAGRGRSRASGRQQA